MDSLARKATRRYVLSSVALAASATALAANVIYFDAGILSSSQAKVLGLLIVGLGIFTYLYLRPEHEYYRKMVQYGCGPIPSYPGDPWGLRFLAESAEAVKSCNLLQLRAQQLNTLGHTFRHRLFPETCMSITTDEPENIKAVLSTKFEDWIIPEHRTRGFAPILGRCSIFTTNGPRWQHARAMLRPAFVRDQISDLACFDRHIAKLVARIPRDGSRCDLQALFAMLTMDSISDFMFGQTTDTLSAAASPRSLQFGSWFEAAIQKIAYRSRLGWLTQILPDRELAKYAAFIQSYVDDFVEEKVRQQEKQEKEEAARGREKDGRKYVFLDELLRSGESKQVVRDQLLSILLAGRDTTTSVLTYLFFELSRRPEVVARIQQEMRDLGATDPSWEQLKSLEYLNWSVKEALRLNPPVPTNARSAVRDTILPTGGGPEGDSPVFIPAGTQCRYQPWSMHRRTDLFGDDAAQFRPERWRSLKVSYVL